MQNKINCSSKDISKFQDLKKLIEDYLRVAMSEFNGHFY